LYICVGIIENKKIGHKNKLHELESQMYWKVLHEIVGKFVIF